MLIIGHRGCNYKGYNQNTIRAYKKVISDGAVAFEMDVQLTRDNKLVVVHNLDLSQVSNGCGLIRETNFDKVESLHAGKESEGIDKIPTLKEVFNLIASYDSSSRPTLHLELKGDDTGRPSGQLLKTEFLDKGLLKVGNILISSFNWKELKEIRKIIPTIRIALLDGSIRRKELLTKIPNGKELFSKIFAYGMEDYMIPKSNDLNTCIKFYEDSITDVKIRMIIINEVSKCLTGAYYNDYLLNEALIMSATSINLLACTATKEFIKTAHKKGLKVFLYTVNTDEEIDKALTIKADGIFTDNYLYVEKYLDNK